MPRWLRRLRARIRNRRFEAELREELDAHRTMLHDDLVAAGVDEDEARTRASRQLGNVTLAREAAREVWVAPWLEGLTYDVRYGVRLLLRRPAFTASAILTLGLGLGAGTSVFGLIDATVLHPLDVPDPSRLFTIQRTDSPRGVEVRRATINWASVERLRAREPFEDMALSTTGADPASQRLLVSAAGPDVADMIDGRFVSASYFRVVGLRPELGRDFEERDDSPTAVPTAILGYRYWQRRFSADSDVIGRWLWINGSAALVIGVEPRGFRGTELGVTQPDIYLPLMSAPRLARDTGVQNDGAGNFWVGTTGRVPSAVSPVASLSLLVRLPISADQQGRATLSSVMGSGEWELVPVADTMVPFASRADLRRFLTLLGWAVGLTLMIGCANLASLLLARAEARRVEFAVRVALGAGRHRRVQQLAVEAALLAGGGGISAVFVAHWVSRGLAVFTLPGGIAISSLSRGMDLRSLGFALMASVVAATLIGVAPAMRAARDYPAMGVRQHDETPRLNLVRALVAVQVAVCLVLVFGAALFVQSATRALGTDLGVRSHDLVSVSLSVPRTPRAAVALEDLLERTRALPGVAAATIGPLPLVQGSDMAKPELSVDGVPVELPEPVDLVFAAADYFTTIGQRILRGRDFTATDRRGSRPVAIVNEAAALRFWPGVDPLERRIGLDIPGAQDVAVVGIVQDVKVRDLREAGRAVIYLARPQHDGYLAGYMAGSGRGFLIARAQGNPSALAPALARLAADAGLPVQSLTTLDDRVGELVMPQRIGRALLGLFGILALALTAVGVYGLVACVVAGRTREIGVRIALGASVTDIVRLVLGGALVPAVAGLAAGISLAWWASRMAAPFMYGIHGWDLTTLSLTAALILAGASLAALAPTRRAVLIDPVETLRAE